MAGGKETPRQKMIGMMYLVLTALLALNISKDVLDAFLVVNKGLEKTNENFNQRNNELYAQFNLAKSVDPVRVKNNWEKAQRIKLAANTLVNYLDSVKKVLIAGTDDVSFEIADTLQIDNITNKDNYDIPTNIMIGDSEDGSKGLSAGLKQKLISYKNVISDAILDKDKNNVVVDIDTDDPKNNRNNENWEVYNFYHRPLVACMTILSKIENDVKNAESTVVDYLLKQADAGSLKFDTVAAKVIPVSNYVMLGEEYKADLFLAAFNKTRNPEILVGNYNESTGIFEGDSNNVFVENGLGKYTAATTSEGIKNYSGVIKVVNPSGKEVVFPYKSEYIVAKPSLTVAADQMNVFYDGLDNPITVSVPGIPSDRLKVSINKGSLRSIGNGKYIVKVNTNNGRTTRISVTATLENGGTKNMGSSEFRVKALPKPVFKYAGLSTSGSLPKSQILAIKYAILKYQNFDFNVRPVLLGYTVTVFSKGSATEFKVTGKYFSEDLKDALKRLKRGDRIIFEGIKAKHANGKPASGVLGFSVKVR